MEYEYTEWYNKVKTVEIVIAVMCFIVSASVIISTIISRNKSEFDNTDYLRYVEVSLSGTGTGGAIFGGQDAAYTVTVKNLRNKPVKVIVTLKIRHNKFTIQDGFVDTERYIDLEIYISANSTEIVSGVEKAADASDMPSVSVHSVKGTLIKE